jgi:iduronate 2-sulfatase
MGVTLTDVLWRYTEWRDAKTQEIKSTELYNHTTSDVATVNVAGHDQYTKLEQRLKTLLHEKFPQDAASFYEKRHVINN